MKNKNITLAIFLALVMMGCNANKEDQSSNENIVENDSSSIPLIIGTYTKKEGHVDGKGKGIYVYAFDTVKGTLTYKNVVEGIINPSYVAASAVDSMVVAVSETPNGNAVSYRFNKADGSLQKMHQQPSFGDYPCHVSVTPNAQYVYVANYGTGSVVSYKVNDNLSLTNAFVNTHEGRGKTSRQEAAHAHMMWPNPHQPLDVFAVDLGIDQVRVYEQSDSSLNLNYTIAMPTGAGPRHIAFHPTDDNEAYVVNELSGTVSLLKKDSSIFHFEKDFDLLEEEPETDDVGAAELQITPDGKYLYASVRGTQNIVVAFRVEANGNLKRIGSQKVGKTPRCIQLSPSGKFLLVANQDDDTIITYQVKLDGGLEEVAVTSMPTPVSLAFFN